MDLNECGGPGADPHGAPNPWRRCSRPLCSRVADVVLLFEYAASHVVLDWSPEFHDPNHLELCLEHAETFRPPNGWSVDDLRVAPAAAERRSVVVSNLR